MKKLINFSKYLFLFASLLFAQVDTSKFQKIIPNKKFEAGSLHRLLYGDYWRDVWTQEFSIPKINFYSLCGGIKHFELKNGFLNVYCNNGRQYRLSPINFDPSKIFSKESQYTFADNILNDQISSTFPFAPQLADDLFTAVGLDNNNSSIMFCTDSLEFEETENKLAGQLCFVEQIRANENEEHFLSTLELLKTIEEEPTQKVNSEEYLKVRLMDILISDWSMLPYQWSWMRDQSEGEGWILAPRLRKNSFVHLDGLFPYSAGFIIPQSASFDEDYSLIQNHTLYTQNLDCRFLTELPFSQWQSVSLDIQNHLTDSVIVNSVKQLPEAINKISEEKLIKSLVSRRDKLSELVIDYYEMINEVSDVYGSNKSDFVLVDRVNNDSTLVEFYKLDGSKQKPTSEPYFQKYFENKITDEIRIHLLGDNDYALVKGRVDDGSLIRIIGDNGVNTFVDSSIVKGKFLSITPIPDAENLTEFYDHNDRSSFTASQGTTVDRTKFDNNYVEKTKYGPSYRDRGLSFVILPDVGYTTNDGILVGGNLSLYKYDFRKIPYQYLQQFSFLYAFLPSTYDLKYHGEFIDVFNNFDFLINLKKSELHFINYFGFGNENDFDKRLYNDKYYRLNQDQFLANPSLRFKISREININFGLFYESNSSSLDNPQLIDDFRFGYYGIGKLENLGINTYFNVDTRNNEYYPTEGDYLKIGGRYYIKTLSSEENYFRSEFDLRKYFTFGSSLETTIALRSSGGKVWGKFPFYHALFLGGDQNIRAYTRERFSGDAAVSFQAEIRTFVTPIDVIVKGDYGINLFAETGRVFAANQNSKRWHPSFGGGIWASYLNRELVFNLTYAYSNDEQNIYLDTRMAF